MREQSLDERIIDYLNGEMTLVEQEAFEKVVDANAHMKEQLDQFIELALVIDDSVEMEVPMSLEQTFNSFLENEINDHEGHKVEPPKVVSFFGRGFQQAAVVLLILGVGLLIGLNLAKEGVINQYAADHDIMMNLLKEQSTSQRIRGVNMSYEMDNNSDVIRMLVERVMEDDSPHVRLQSVDALSPYTEDSGVRQALIHAASKDKDASVQVAAIQLLKQTDHQDVIKTFDDIIQNRNSMNFVRDEAHSGKLHWIQNTY